MKDWDKKKKFTNKHCIYFVPFLSLPLRRCTNECDMMDVTDNHQLTKYVNQRRIEPKTERLGH